MEDRHEAQLAIIDAFIDGERVDADALKEALAESSGRDYLVDAWLLREAARTDPPRLRSVQADRSAQAEHLEGSRQDPDSRPSRTSWWLVAAVFTTALVGGYAAGANITRSSAPAAGGNSAPVAVSPSPTSAGPFPVPPPSRVIQLEFRSTSASNGGD